MGPQIAGVRVVSESKTSWKKSLKPPKKLKKQNLKVRTLKKFRETFLKNQMNVKRKKAFAKTQMRTRKKWPRM